MKSLFLIFTMLSSQVCINAQIEAGFKMGLSFSNLRPDCQGVDCPYTRVLPGVLFGLTMDIPLDDDLTLQPELFYVTKGFEGRPDLTSAEIVNYVALPIMLNYQVTPRLGLKAGPEYSYEFNHLLLNGTSIRDVTEDTIRKFDTSLSIGFCIQLNYRWYLDLRYTEGLSLFAVDEPRPKYRSVYLSFNRLLEVKGD